MADRVAVMIEGRIAQVDAPRIRALAAFIGQHQMNVLPAGPAALLDPAGARLAIGMRPDALWLAPGGPLVAVVTGVALPGEETLVTLRRSGSAPLRLGMRRAAPPGTGVVVRLAAAGALHRSDAVGLRQGLTWPGAGPSRTRSWWVPRPWRRPSSRPSRSWPCWRSPTTRSARPWPAGWGWGTSPILAARAAGADRHALSGAVVVPASVRLGHLAALGRHRLAATLPRPSRAPQAAYVR
jgi:hypothetical protein